MKKRAVQLVKRALRGVVARVDVSSGLAPSLWGLSPNGSGELELGGVPLLQLRKDWGSPLHVVDGAKLRKNAADFLTVPAGCESGAEVYYSYKTNPVPGVLSLLHGAGVGAEVISEYELWLALKLGVAPERIVFNGPAKSDAAVRQAVELGIQTLNLNHREEIPRVAQLARSLGKKLRVGLRVTLGEGWSAQFGIPVAGGEALAAYREVLASDSLEPVGLHAHRGGMIHNEDELNRFVDLGLDFAQVLKDELALELSVLNFGGSLGTPSVQGLSARDRRLNQTLLRELPAPDPERALGIARYVSLLVSRVEERYRAAGRTRPRIFLEPGRAMTGNAQFLLATLLTTKAAKDLTFAILDAGINHAESVRAEYHQLLCVNRAGLERNRTYTVVGPICSPGDTLYPAVRLPELQPGDCLAIMDSGAYFVPFSTSFSFPRPAIVLVENGKASLLRRAERFDDILLCDDLGGA